MVKKPWRKIHLPFLTQFYFRIPSTNIIIRLHQYERATTTTENNLQKLRELYKSATREPHCFAIDTTLINNNLFRSIIRLTKSIYSNIIG